MINILIVDDIDSFRKDIIKVVANVFYDANIIDVSSYKDAIDKIKYYRFEIVITDIKLNGINDELNEGLQVAQFAKRSNNSTEVIVITSYLNEESIFFALQRSAVDIKLLNRAENSYFDNLKIQLSLIKTKIAPLSPEAFWDQILQDRDKYSYWILFMNSLDIEIDKVIAGEVLIWQASIAKYESVVHLCQIPDKGFDALCKQFEIKDYPSLIVSNNKYMDEYILIKPNEMKKLIVYEESKSNRDALRPFLTKIHVQLRNGISIKSIKTKIQTKEYWDWVVWGAKEFKGDIIKLITG